MGRVRVHLSFVVLTRAKRKGEAVDAVSEVLCFVRELDRRLCKARIKYRVGWPAGCVSSDVGRLLDRKRKGQVRRKPVV